jgi:hypothetical protein
MGEPEIRSLIPRSLTGVMVTQPFTGNSIHAELEMTPIELKEYLKVEIISHISPN